MFLRVKGKAFSGMKSFPSLEEKPCTAFPPPSGTLHSGESRGERGGTVQFSPAGRKNMVPGARSSRGNAISL